MKLSLLSKSLLLGVLFAVLLPTAHADSRRGGRGDGNRGDGGRGHSGHYDRGSRGDSRGHYSHGHYSRGRGYYGRPYNRSYYGYGYGYGYPYYFGRPRTTIAIGVGSGGYYGTNYAGSYGRDDDDRPIYRGKQISENSSSSLEISVQQKLSRLGYYKGSIDGSVGPATRSAISRYQRDNDLAETGRIDRGLVNALDLS